ncbi:hypothetical protein V6N13_094261 [Hibiscus sabdariffa]|uniref:Uncharacterized protein n=1 Tax=Hibiscus sabdariffa TaxID=183260 RepID=A0ABR2PQ96_9ROSI
MIAKLLNLVEFKFFYYPISSQLVVRIEAFSGHQEFTQGAGFNQRPTTAQGVEWDSLKPPPHVIKINCNAAFLIQSEMAGISLLLAIAWNSNEKTGIDTSTVGEVLLTVSNCSDQSFSHVFRKQNKPEDWIAKKAKEREGSHS